AYERPNDVVRGDAALVVAIDDATLGGGDGAPDRQQDYRLEQESQQPDHVAQAVLHLPLHRDAGVSTGDVREGSQARDRRDVRFRRRGLSARSGTRRRHAHCAASTASAAWNTISMTSSMGGSSTVRSCTSYSASSSAVTRAVSDFGTRTRTAPP